MLRDCQHGADEPAACTRVAGGSIALAISVVVAIVGSLSERMFVYHLIHRETASGTDRAEDPPGVTVWRIPGGGRGVRRWAPRRVAGRALTRVEARRERVDDDHVACRRENAPGGEKPVAWRTARHHSRSAC